jgi:hypothetical protein
VIYDRQGCQFLLGGELGRIIKCGIRSQIIYSEIDEQSRLRIE